MAGRWPSTFSFCSVVLAGRLYTEKRKCACCRMASLVTNAGISARWASAVWLNSLVQRLDHGGTCEEQNRGAASAHAGHQELVDGILFANHRHQVLVNGRYRRLDSIAEALRDISRSRRAHVCGRTACVEGEAVLVCLSPAGAT